MDNSNPNQLNSFLQLLSIDDVFRSILDFITPQATLAVKGSAPATALFATAKELREAKRKYFYWKFTRAKSFQYFADPTFRAICDSLANTKAKLALTLSSKDNITDVSMLGNVHTLNLGGCGGITDVSMLGNVHALNLIFCTGITDVSMLGNVHRGESS